MSLTYKRTDSTSPLGKYYLSLKKKEYLLFIGPGLIFLSLILFFPLIFSFVISFFDWQLIQEVERKFVGLSNYLSLFSNPDFWKALWLHITFVVAGISMQLIIGLMVALFLNRKFFGDNIVRALLILPVFVLPVVSGLTFRFMYDPQFGAINWFITSLGFQPIAFLSRPNTALLAIIIQDIWRMWPFMFMIIYAGLSSLPVEPFEAAKLDGAGKLKTFWYITLPLLRPTIMVAIILRVVDALKAFSEIYVMTGGGPGDSTAILSIFIHKHAFRFYNMGYSAAASYVLVLIALIFSSILVRNMFPKEDR